MTRTLVALPQNETHVESLAALERELQQRGVPVSAIDLSGVFHQQLGLDALSGEVFRPPIATNESFYRLHPAAQIRTVMTAVGALRPYLEMACAVLAFNDGAIQRVMLRAARTKGIPTFLLLDGMISSYGGSGKGAWRRILSWLNRRLGSHAAMSFLPTEIGMTDVDVLLVIGPHSAAVLRGKGARAGQIVATGLPRWPQQSEAQRPERARRVLYLTGAFAWHGYREAGRYQLSEVRTVANVCHRLGLDFTIRVHPRDDLGKYKTMGRTIPSSQEPLWQSLRDADVVLSYVSTGLLEAITLRRLARVVAIHMPWDFLAPSFAADPMFEAIRTEEALQASLRLLADHIPESAYAAQEAGFGRYVAGDGQAAARAVADRIADVIARS